MWLALSSNGTFPHVFMARIEHYYIISCNAVYPALIRGIKHSCWFPQHAFGFKTCSTSAFCAAGPPLTTLPAPSPTNFLPSQFHKYGSVWRIGCYNPMYLGHTRPTPSPSLCTGCCVVLPAQVSPNPFPRPCRAINPHPQTIGQS